MKSMRFFCGTVVLGMLLSATATAATLYVAPNGNDRSDGSSANAPLATLNAALARMRQTTPAAGEPRRIVLLPGTYQLAEPVRLTAQDSGTEANPLVIEAQEPGSVTLSGGRVLPPFSASGNVWSTAVDVQRGFHMLWVDGQRAVRARSPNGHAFYTGAANTRKPQPEGRPVHPDNLENMRSLVMPDTVRRELARAVAAAPLQGMNLTTMHSWTSANQQIKSYDSDTGVMVVSPDGKWPFLRFGQPQRFALENHPAFLDEAGEWWMSPDWKLSYLPRPGEDIASARAVAPQLENLMAIAGAAGRPVRHVVVRGLRFSHSAAWLVPFVDGQAGIDLPSAVTVDNAQRVEFDDCEFSHIGGYALWLRTGAQQNTVRRSVFFDLGGGGIRVGNTGGAANADARTEGNVITNNLVTQGGRAFPGAIGIWVGQSARNEIVHNELSDLYYTGISVGWTWGFGRSDAAQNRIENNYLHEIGQRMLNDLGAIYTLGRTQGSVIAGNRIENVYSFAEVAGAVAWGIFLDEGTSDAVVERNVVLHTTGGGFNLHYGRNNVVRNNVFAYGGMGVAKRSRKGPDSQITVERNVLVTDDSPVFYGEWDDVDALSRNNLVYRRSSDRVYKDLSLGGLAAAGQEKLSVFANPQLQCKDGDCTVSAQLAKQVGFEPFTTQDAGIKEEGGSLNRCRKDPTCATKR